jgi:hypothetical protein
MKKMITTALAGLAIAATVGAVSPSPASAATCKDSSYSSGHGAHVSCTVEILTLKTYWCTTSTCSWQTSYPDSTEAYVYYGGAYYSGSFKAYTAYGTFTG